MNENTLNRNKKGQRCSKIPNDSKVQKVRLYYDA